MEIDNLSFTLRIFDSLLIMSHAFESRFCKESTDGMVEFCEAYINQGTIKRPRPPLRSASEDIFSDHFHTAYAYSRRATEPRDYVFATMPQFPWYHYPDNAENMTFDEIFEDLYQQAIQSDHAFTCRVTRSMIERLSHQDASKWWIVSSEQPNPNCLGDFLKLFGHRVDPLDSFFPRIKAPVTVHGVNSKWRVDSILDIITNAIKFSSRPWNLSYQSGDISKYGGYPEDDIVLDGDRETAKEFSSFPNLAKALMVLDIEEEEKRRALLTVNIYRQST
jgi:hypothetical protein